MNPFFYKELNKSFLELFSSCNVTKTESQLAVVPNNTATGFYEFIGWRRGYQQIINLLVEGQRENLSTHICKNTAILTTAKRD